MFKNPANQLLQKVRQMRNVTSPYLHSVVRNLEMVNGHTDYTKFIILGRSRSGSNFLRGLLNSHSRVVAFGEIFQNDKGIEWGLSGYPQSSQMLASFRNEPVDFIQSQIFKKHPKRVQAVGFKLFYYHAHTELWEPVWTYLAEQKTVKVLHIRRENLLKTHLSRKKALLTDQWVNTSGEKEEFVPLTLDYEECLADFIQTRQWESEYARFFAEHSVLDVSYEALARDHLAEMQRVQNFLGLDAEPPKLETYRQAHHPLSVAIANYHELKEKFEGTEWQAFFKD
jgi:LPS sulfotransferase NodH